MNPDALTRCWDVYPKEGDSDYARINPQNLRPMFTSRQLISSLRASSLYEPALRALFMIDDDQLRKDIRSGISLDPVIAPILEDLRSNSMDPKWSMDDDGLLCEHGKIYVPDVNNLRLCVLRSKHDPPLARHFGQTKTTALVFRDYTWPKLRGFVLDFCKSCTICGRGKPLGISHMERSSSYPYPRNCGILFQWISLSNSLRALVLLQS